MSTAVKIFTSVFGLLVLVVLVCLLYGMIYPGRFTGLIAPDSSFSWENFGPLDRDPGLMGFSPLIWTALVVVPLSIGLPLLIYLYEKKKIHGLTRGFLAVTRMAVLLVLYLLLAGPSLVDREVYVEGSKVAILIDDSLSMGEESREFPVFNVLDDRESADVKLTRDTLTNLGIRVDRPPTQGFVTLSADELAVRNFVRKVVRERSQRLVTRLQQMHGTEFKIQEWQQLRADVVKLSQEADLLQSALSAEVAKKKTPEDDSFDTSIRVLQSDLNDKLKAIADREASFAKLLGGDIKDPAVQQKRALINNLLETVHPEGPRRWDIACELVTPGTKLAVPKGQDLGLVDLLKQRAVEIEAKGRNAGSEDARGMSMVRYFVFSTKFGREQLTDEAILEIDPLDLDFRAPTGRLTELHQSMTEVRRYYTEEDDLATIMVLSDGRDTRPQEESETPAAVKPQGGLEVVTIAIGNPKPVKVLELLSVSADREILKGDYLDFKLKIRADKAYRANPAEGKPGIQVKIILCEDSLTNPIGYDELNGRPVKGPEGMTMELGPEELAEVKIRFKPRVTGKHVYFLKLNDDRLPDEDTYRNNVKEHYVEIIDRKIKVLYLEQSFRHEARFLNENLKRDKKLEYQGFFFDAQDGWTQPTSIYDEEVKKTVKPLLYPFFGSGKIVREKEEFFKLNYDVIILGDIDPAHNFWRLEYWDWLEEWVSRHRGGLILLAGQGHNPKDYANYEKARALFPVELDFPGGDYDKLVMRSQEKYWRLTPAGRAHELHRLSSNQDRNDELWGKVVEGDFEQGELHGLYWYQHTGGIKPAPAVVLSRVVKPGPVSGEGEILSAAMPYGNGMSLYFGTDDMHYWRQWVGEYYFYRYWQNAIRFVASRRLAGKQQRVDVYTDKTKYQVSEDVKIYVELMGDIYGEVVQNQLKELKELPTDEEVEIRKLIVDVQARSQGRLSAHKVVLREVSWSPNLFEGMIEANEPGLFDVWVRDYEESRKAPHRYTVIAPIAELRDLTLDVRGLKDMATKLPENAPQFEYQDGKRMYLMTDAGDASLLVREREQEIEGINALVWDRKEEPFGLRSLLLGLLILLLAGEWLTRKLVRMV